MPRETLSKSVPVFIHRKEKTRNAVERHKKSVSEEDSVLATPRRKVKQLEISEEPSSEEEEIIEEGEVEEDEEEEEDETYLKLSNFGKQKIPQLSADAAVMFGGLIDRK
jgi:hypothetical protein